MDLDQDSILIGGHTFSCGDLVEYRLGKSIIRGIIQGFNTNQWPIVCGRRKGEKSCPVPPKMLNLVPIEELSSLNS